MISPNWRPQGRPATGRALFAAMVCTLTATGPVVARWIQTRLHRSRSFLLALAFCSVALPQSVSAAPITIGFDAVTTTGVFSYGPVTEDGFDYDLLPTSGGLFGWAADSGWGTPAPSMEGYVETGGGTLSIRRSDLSTFTFVSADIANWLGEVSAPKRTIEFIGLMSGVALVPPDVFETNGGNWTDTNVWKTVKSVALAGVWIDELLVRLDAGRDQGIQWAESVDSIVLIDAPTPLALLGLGMALIGYGRRGAVRQR